MQIPDNILDLIEKYQAGTATPEEKNTLNAWYRSFNDAEAEIQTSELLTEEQLEERIRNRMLKSIEKKQTLMPLRPRRKWQLPAAAILLFLIAGVYFIFLSKLPKKDTATATAPNLINDIAPGGNKAILTLSDNSTIVLDNMSNGTVVQEGNIKVEKLSNGLLAYNIHGKLLTENDKEFYNTITTPRGGQYQVTLSDGTKVWLNAASSIRFPVVFIGNERKVEITGEAYFEVVKNTGKPFKVSAGSSQIEVMGTHFNVNSYDDEATIKTTLLEGLVKVSVNNQSAKFLRPGQQSGISKDGKIAVLDNADTEEAIAWINGRFQYKSADIKTILRQISRWYDVDIEYRGNVDIHFTGQLPRNQNVSGIFEKLALTGEVNFKIEGRKIIVSP
jgi:ferric-dicitrate binding protein FerR (iron transport regulator)